MKHIKSERLKKLESDLTDLEQWLKLGLVPKKDVEKHKEEIVTVKTKIEEEKERLQFLRESGEAEEYIAPKRTPTRHGYTEMPTIPDIDIAETAMSETGFDVETENGEFEGSSASNFDEEEEDDEATKAEGEEDDEEEEEEESYFSDRNRWRRGGIVDPDANEW